MTNLASTIGAVASGPVGLALALAQYAPSLMRYFGAGESSVVVAEKVVAIADQVTGGGLTPEQMLQRLRDDAQAVRDFQMAALKVDADLEQAYLADRDSARKRDAELIRAGMRNTRADIMFALAVLVTCLLVLLVWRAPDVGEYLKGIVTLVLGRFLGYLDNIYNFEFGTTRGSRQKDEIVANAITPETLERVRASMKG